MECYICGVSDERTKLFDAVVKEGLVKVCENCSIKENIHIIRRVENLQVKETEQSQTVYEKLSKMAGVDPKEHKAKFGSPSSRKITNLNDLRKNKKEKELSYSKLNQINSEFKDDLIRNYHWAIFKARRAMKLTQKQLAEAISETEESIKYIERGVLPDNYQAFIKKIESCLGITLFKKPEIQKKAIVEVQEPIEEVEKLSFFAAWRERRKRRKNEKKAQQFERVEINTLKEAESQDINELSQEEMDKIIFGNKENF